MRQQDALEEPQEADIDCINTIVVHIGVAGRDGQRMSALTNFVLTQFGIAFMFLLSLFSCCKECQFCRSGQATCLDVPGLSLDMATSVGPGAQLFMAYVVILFMCIAHCNPMLNKVYPEHKWGRFVLLCLLGLGTALFYLFPERVAGLASATFKACYSGKASSLGGMMVRDGTSGTTQFQFSCHSQPCCFENPQEVEGPSSVTTIAITLYWTSTLLFTLFATTETALAHRWLLACVRLCLVTLMGGLLIFATIHSSSTGNKDQGTFWAEVFAHCTKILFVASLGVEVSEFSAMELVVSDIQLADGADGQAMVGMGVGMTPVSPGYGRTCQDSEASQAAQLHAGDKFDGDCGSGVDSGSGLEATMKV